MPFACWKELLQNGETVKDDLLIEQFYDWSKEKAKFEEQRLKKAIGWMKGKRIVSAF